MVTISKIKESLQKFEHLVKARFCGYLWGIKMTTKKKINDLEALHIYDNTP